MREFYRVVRIFRKELPEYRFKVRRLKLAKNYYGTCEFNDGVFLISLDEKMNEDMTIHILIHELAHMISWNEPGDIHNSKWGIAYSKIYRIFINKYINGDPK